MKNPYFEEIQAVFRKRIVGWDEIPTGDPVRVMAEALALSLGNTDTRYRRLLDHVVDSIPSILGFQSNQAAPGTVRVHIAANTKLKENIELPMGTLLAFKAGERRFEVVTRESVLITPLEKIFVEGSISEVVEDRMLGHLEGVSWESLALPPGLVVNPKLLTIRFPDETSKTLSGLEASQLLLTNASAGLGDSFVCSSGKVSIPAADKHVAGYRATVRVHVPEMRLVADIQSLPLGEFKFVGEKSNHLAEVTLSAIVSNPIPAETAGEFQKRFQFVQQHALVAFNGRLAHSAEEIKQALKVHFPTQTFEVSIDGETETVLVKVAQAIDALMKRQVRHAVENKVSLRYEVVVTEGEAASFSGAAYVH